jgi:hypothetical protein
MGGSEDPNWNLAAVGNQDLLEPHDGGIGSQTLVDVILMAIFDHFLNSDVSHGAGVCGGRGRGGRTGGVESKFGCWSYWSLCGAGWLAIRTQLRRAIGSGDLQSADKGEAINSIKRVWKACKSISTATMSFQGGSKAREGDEDGERDEKHVILKQELAAEGLLGRN